jgi:hypothetical protein
MTSRETAPGLVIVSLRNRWPALLVLAAVLGGAAATGALLFGRPEYVATRVYLSAALPAVPGIDEDVVTTNTDRRAQDYATVLLRDDNLLNALGHAVNRSRSEVRKTLQAYYIPKTSTIAIRWRAPTRHEAVQLVAALDAAIAARDLAVRNFPSRYMRPLDGPYQIDREQSLLGHPAVAALPGLVMALLVVILVERAAPSVVGAGQLRAALGVRVVEVPEIDADAVDQLVHAVEGGEDAQGSAFAVLAPIEGRAADADHLVTAVRSVATGSWFRPSSDADARRAQGALLVTRYGDPLRAVVSARDAVGARVPAVVLLVSPARSLATT